MSFSAEIKEQALVASARHCCICHRFCGLKVELHHVVHKAAGGADTLDNCIPLCFDCHADMRSYDHKHPKGTKYTPAELRKHRDEWYKKVSGSPVVTYSEKTAELDRAVFGQLRSLLPWDGSIAFVRDNNFAGFAFQRTRLDELDRFLDRCRDPAFEFIDIELEGFRALLAKCIQSFTNQIGENTWPLDHRIELSTVPPDWETEDPERFCRVVESLHASAGQIGETYDNLTRTARRKLGVT